jgi:hypothetical protein
VDGPETGGQHLRDAGLHVYVGPWKTGSSAVRLAIRNSVAERGSAASDIQSDDESGHAWLVFDRPSGSVSPSAPGRFVASLYPGAFDWAAAWERESRRLAASRTPAFLVASEFLHLADDPARVFAEAWGERNVCVCCVRSQADVAESLVAELVKEPLVDVEAARSLAIAMTVDYEAQARRWLEAGGEARFVPYGPDVVPPVLRALGVDPGRWPGGVRANVRQSNAAVSYLYERKAARLGDPNWGAVCEAFHAAASAAGLGAPRFSLLSSDGRAAVAARTAASNRRFAAARPAFAACLGEAAAFRDEPLGSAFRRRCDVLFAAAETFAEGHGAESASCNRRESAP